VSVWVVVGAVVAVWVALALVVERVAVVAEGESGSKIGGGK
jgi:hypothetical protein